MQCYFGKHKEVFYLEFINFVSSLINLFFTDLLGHIQCLQVWESHGGLTHVQLWHPL